MDNTTPHLSTYETRHLSSDDPTENHKETKCSLLLRQLTDQLCCSVPVIGNRNYTLPSSFFANEL